MQDGGWPARDLAEFFYLKQWNYNLSKYNSRGFFRSAMGDKLAFWYLIYVCVNVVIASDKDNLLDEGQQKTQFEAAFQGTRIMILVHDSLFYRFLGNAFWLFIHKRLFYFYEYQVHIFMQKLNTEFKRKQLHF